MGAIFRDGPESTPSVDLVAQARDPGTGTNATVIVTPRGDTVDVRVTFSGLRPGTTYRLILVTRANESLVVAEWRSPFDTQILEGSVPVTAAELDYFLVWTQTGDVVLSIPFGRGAAPTAMPR